MNEITPLLEQYNGLVNVIMHTDYSVQEYKETQTKLADTLKAMNGKLNREHLHSLTRVTQVLTTETVMIPMAETVCSINSQESFDYLLNQFFECFDDGRQELTTAEACYQGMIKLDPARVKREGIDQHPLLF